MDIQLEVFWTKDASSDVKYWKTNNKKIIERIKVLIEDIKLHPFIGIGKPEPLKHNLNGYWSRRINSQHRLIYRIENAKIIIIGCRYHYC